MIGEDGRTSTSKTFVLMWTLLVAWAIVALLIAGAVLTLEPCVTAGHSTNQCMGDPIGLLQLGWQAFLANGLDAGYLVLLAVPAGAAIAAKAITQSKVDTGVTPPVPLSAGDKRPSARISQVFSADDGSTDIADFQYVIFNVLLATYFVIQVLRVSAVGLPALPATLLGLTGVSAALYVGKKAVGRTQPTITAVFPTAVSAGQMIIITGTNLTANVNGPAGQQPAGGFQQIRVSVNGAPANVRQPDPNVPDRVLADVPNGLNTTGSPIPGTVEVLNPYGFKTPPYPVTINP
jgi:hypothetical protein